MGLGVLEGRSALIPGARRGIGRAIALAFAREGADVAINHHPPADAKFPEAADEGAREVRSLGRRGPLFAPGLVQEEPVSASVELVPQSSVLCDIFFYTHGCGAPPSPQ